MRATRGKRIEAAWAALHAAADLAAARGSLLFHLDLATELARVAFAARGIATARLATTADPLGYRVFAMDGGAGATALAGARFDRAGRISIDPYPAHVPPRATALADARLTIAATPLVDTATQVALVVPAHDPDRPIEGYAMAASDHPDRAMTGGHWLVGLTPCGTTLLSRERLDAGPRAISIARLRDTIVTTPGAVPHEAHVYLSLKHDVPFVVAAHASGVRWRVDGERLTPLPVDVSR